MQNEERKNEIRKNFTQYMGDTYSRELKLEFDDDGDMNIYPKNSTTIHGLIEISKWADFYSCGIFTYFDAVKRCPCVTLTIPERWPNH